MSANDLPEGIARSNEASPDATLDNCFALKFDFAGPDAQGTRSVIVWRDGPKNIRPLEKTRLRDVRPGDHVESFGKRECVVAVEIYR
jgi:hypothetical protein